MSVTQLQFQKERIQKKKRQDCSFQENLLLNLNFNDSDMKAQNLNEEYNEVHQLVPINSTSRTNGSNVIPELTEENILYSMDTNLTEVTFDITKDHNEYRGLLTGVTNVIEGTCLANVKRRKHCNKCYQRDLTVTFSSDHAFSENETGVPFVGSLKVERAMLVLGCQKLVAIDCKASLIERPLVVCSSDSGFLVAPVSVNTHSLGFFLKYQGAKKINHAFDVTKVDLDLYRKYLILMTLTCRLPKYYESFPSCTLFPFPPTGQTKEKMLDEEDLLF